MAPILIHRMSDFFSIQEVPIFIYLSIRTYTPDIIIFRKYREKQIYFLFVECVLWQGSLAFDLHEHEFFGNNRKNRFTTMMEGKLFSFAPVLLFASYNV